MAISLVQPVVSAGVPASMIFLKQPLAVVQAGNLNSVLKVPRSASTVVVSVVLPEVPGHRNAVRAGDCG
jgi:hypothetical protein